MPVLLTTIGTSILTNPPREGRPWPKWNREKRPPLPPRDADTSWIRDDELLEISAETNTWSRLGVFDAPEAFEAILLFTDTAEGKFCAEHLSRFLASKGVKNEIDKVPKLGNESSSFYVGLSNLVGALLGWIERVDGPQIVATGGFKPEAAAASIVGSLKSVPVHYVHESFRDLVTLPLLPIGIDITRFNRKALSSLLSRLPGTAVVPRSELDAFLTQDPNLAFLVDEEMVDERPCVSLNVMGQLAADALRSGQAPVSWPEASARAPDQKSDHSGKAHHRPDNSQQVVDFLARYPFVHALRVDNGLSPRPGIAPAADATADIAVTLTSDGKPPFRLRVTTTAKSAEQREMVISHLREQLRPYFR